MPDDRDTPPSRGWMFGPEMLFGPKTEAAIVSFEKVLEIDPENERAKEMNDKLRGESE